MDLQNIRDCKTNGTHVCVLTYRGDQPLVGLCATAISSARGKNRFGDGWRLFSPL